MNPTVRLVLFSALGALAGLWADGLLPLLGAAAGALVALRLRDAERLRQGAERLRDLDARLRAVERSGAPAPPGEAAPAAPASRPTQPVERAAEPPVLVVDAGRQPAAPRRPAAAPLLERLPPEARRVWDFVTGGNALARVGLVVLFVGLGLLVRYAVEQGVLSVELRLAFAAAVGAALVGIGWRLRDGTPGFGLTLQGGGVAVLYLTVYSAYAFYGLIPSLAAIVLMALVAVGCGVLAVVQDAPGLAVLGVTGGFAAPVVAGSPEGHHVLLLSYYALLNLGVLGVAWAKGWRSVAVVGFVSTFVTGSLWGGLQYRPEWYATVQPFVVLSFAVYLALAVRFALRSAQADPPERSLAVDGGLVFGLPAATFALQAGLVEGVVPYGRAWSAAVLAAVYLAGAGLLRPRAGVRLLADAFLAVGLAFATLALPLAFQRVVVGAMWVPEGAALVWVGARQDKPWMRWGGIALQAVAASVLFTEGVLAPSSTFTAESLTGWIVAVGLAVSAWVLRGAPDARETAGFLRGSASRARERTAGRLLLGFALFWWTTTAAVHVLDLAPDRWTLAGMLAAAAASGALFLSVGRALGWRGLAAAAFGVVPAGAVLWAVAVASEVEPLVWGRGPAWLALLAVAALALRLEQAHPLRPWAFVGAVWLATAVAARSLGVPVGQATAGDWGLGVVGAVLATALALTLRTPRAIASDPERQRAAGGLVLAAGGWMVLAWSAPGLSPPLPFVPVLNALGLPTLAAWLVLSAARHDAGGRLAGAVALGALGFGALTAEVLRTVSAWGGLPWSADVLWTASVAQAALAVAWTLLALAVAVVAVRRQSRALWFFGAGVLGLVVAKLFLVDLSQAEALVRIGAFITVGTLVLLIGYRAPLPPARAGHDEANGALADDVGDPAEA